MTEREITSGPLSVLPSRVSECSLSHNGTGDSCLRASDMVSVVRAVGAQDMESAKEKTGCTSEKCVVAAAAPKIGHRIANELIANNYKIEGPTNSALLSNVNIDTILQQWAKRWPDFYPYNFNMYNYTEYNYQKGYVEKGPDTLATVNVGDLYKSGVRTAACVINTDVYQGGGKHWMCLFVDMRSTPATVEYFNSAGGCATSGPWFNWLVKTRDELRDAGLAAVEIVNCSGMRWQDSMSECGVYSLFYIWGRLNGIGAAVFRKQSVHDKYMFEFRQHLFAHPTAVDSDGKFNWDAYQKAVSIEWQ